jgi:prepilin peptidase CpaA
VGSLEQVSLLVFAVIVLIGAYWDLRFRMIPNALNALLVISGGAAAWLVTGWEGAGVSLLHATMALAIGLVLYSLGMWGGGDAKLYAGSAAWFSLAEAPRLAIAIALAGFIVLIVWFGRRRIMARPHSDGLRSELPYGIAIAGGGLCTMAMRTFT